MGQRWGLKSRINEGIATKKLTKTNFTHPLHLKEWVGQLIIINKVQYVTSMTLNMRFNIPICIFLPMSYNFLLLYDVNNFWHLNFYILETFSSADVSPPSTLACTCSSIYSLGADASASSTLTCTYSSIFSLKANASASSTLTYTCCPTTLAFTSPFITPPMPSIDLVRACWCIATFLVFFRMCI